MIRRRRNQSRKPKILLFATISLALLAIIVTFTFGYMKLLPSKDIKAFEQNQANPIFINHQLTPYSAIVEDKVVKLPLTFLNEILLDFPIYFEPDTETIVLTSTNQVMRFKTESIEALLNEKEYSLTLKADLIDGEVYLPSELIYEWYQINVDLLDSGVVHVYDKQQQIQHAVVSHEKGTQLRSQADVKSPYYFELPKNEMLYIVDANIDDWYVVQTKAGYNGYVKSNHITFTELVSWDKQIDEEQFTPSSLDGKKINLTWEAIYNRQPNLSNMPNLEGVNVVSPTWFELIDEQGTIQGKATHEYMNWAHNKGFHVWALVSNGFDPDWTTQVLSSAETRFHMIEQLVLFAQTYHFEGINIDFENVYTHDKENFVQFIRELTPFMHKLGLVVSVDVTPKSNSEMWFSLCQSVAKIV